MYQLNSCTLSCAFFPWTSIYHYRSLLAHQKTLPWYDHTLIGNSETNKIKDNPLVGDIHDLSLSQRYLLFACSKLCTLTATAAGGQNLSSSLLIILLLIILLFLLHLYPRKMDLQTYGKMTAYTNLFSYKKWLFRIWLGSKMCWCSFKVRSS